MFECFYFSFSCSPPLPFVHVFYIVESTRRKGGTVTTATKTPKQFRNQRKHDPDSECAQAIRDTYWTMFGHYSFPGYDVDDFDATVTKLQLATGWHKGFVKNAILGHAALQDLPRLRELQQDTRVMDIGHLTAVYTGIEELGPDATEEALELIDDILCTTFTPKRHDQAVPQRKTVTDRIRAAIKKMDPSRAYDKRKRDERVKDTTDSFGIYEYKDRATVQLDTNSLYGRKIQANVAAVARELGISAAEAAIKLLSGEIAGIEVTPVLNIYTPRNRAVSGPVYIPGSGWTTPEATTAFEDWLATNFPILRDLDKEAEKVLQGYGPGEAMRHAVYARNRTCIYPECNRPAEQCQLDHRIPYDEGGRTEVDNLFPLCQHHHNMKTDRRIFYVPDPYSGDIIWLFADGSYEVTAEEGILRDQITPYNPRWQSSMHNVRKNRARAAEFFAKGHTILDAFEEDLDLEQATAAIEDLEQEYGMTFGFAPEMPYVEPFPEEPVDAPFPDPQEET